MKRSNMISITATQDCPYLCFDSPTTTTTDNNGNFITFKHYYIYNYTPL